MVELRVELRMKAVMVELWAEPEALGSPAGEPQALRGHVMVEEVEDPKVGGQDRCPPPAPRRRWTSPHRGGEGLGPGWGPWSPPPSPPPRGGQGQGGDDQEDAHVPGQALDLLKSGGV